MASSCAGARPPTRVRFAKPTKTPSSPNRWCSPSPTAWAATAPARSPAPLPPASCATVSRGGAINEDYVAGVVAEANTAIFGAARANAEQTRHGHHPHRPHSAAAAHEPGRGTFALLNVGDSRTYRFRHDKLVRVTVDHSYVQELVVNRATSPRKRHVPTPGATSSPAPSASTRTCAPTFGRMPIVRGDRFVLCSDGLVDEVPDHEIAI